VYVLVLHVTVLVCVPVLQLPQDWLVAGLLAAGQSCPPQLPQAQEEVQVCVPPVPQDCVSPAAHTPPPLHVPHVPVDHVYVLVLHVTVLVCVPVLQLPQDWLVVGLLAAGQF
jgi:hypothetical protein